MSKLISTLKFSSATKPAQQSSVALRRSKLAAKLEEQIMLARAENEGNTLALTKQRTIKNKDTGAVHVVEVPKRVAKWWFVTEDGTLALNVRYGTKLLEFAKGKSAIEIADAGELLPTLQALRSAVQVGELDAQIDAASKSIRARFV